LKVYSSARDGFEIGVPRGDWEIEDSEQQLSPILRLVVILLNPGKTRDGFTPNVNVLVETINSPIDIQDYTARTEEISRRMCRSYKKHALKDKTVGSIQATEIIYSAIEDGRRLKHKQLKCIFRQRAFIITASDLSRNFRLVREDFDKILDSFRLLD